MMTTIFCTNKLAKLIGTKSLSQNINEGIIGNWNANIFHVNRRKWLYLINERTCYSIIIPNFLKKQLNSFDQLFYTRLIDQLYYDGIEISQHTVNKLRNQSFSFSKTNNNRPIIGTMTNFIKDLNYYIFYQYEELSLLELNNRLTDNLVTVFAKGNDMDSPKELMREQIYHLNSSA